MDKYPRSGPLFDAISEIYLRENLYDQSRTMSEVVKDAAKKYKVPIEQLKNVLPNANEAFEGGSLPPPKANIGKAAPAELSMAEKYKAAENASIERGAKGLEKNLVSPTAEKYKAVLTEGEKKMARSILSGNIGKAAPMETPYGKSFLSYTPEGKIAGKAGSMLRGLGRVAGPLGAALTALDLAQGLGEVQDKGAAKIAEDYKKSKMAESEAEILTPEADQFRESLKSRRTELEILRAELERKRKEEEKYKQEDDQRIARQARVRDTLEQTGLIP
jgi:hypothetical protein